jgi:glycerophosphoryl diester phosphodiesterase
MKFGVRQLLTRSCGSFILSQRAIEVGADFIETDILATKDGKLFCMHDVTLEATTDVANHTRFADRIRTYEVQGANVTGRFSGTTQHLHAPARTLSCHKAGDAKTVTSSAEHRYYY